METMSDNVLTCSRIEALSALQETVSAATSTYWLNAINESLLTSCACHAALRQCM